jgi:malic enzyme
MKIAAVEAIRALAKEPVPAEVLTAAGVSELAFGKDYVIPKPMDARLLPRVARAVALAAVASGVARIELPGTTCWAESRQARKTEGPLSGAPFLAAAGAYLVLGATLTAGALAWAAL